jgi:catechol-2,3-dioxygenase
MIIRTLTIETLHLDVLQEFYCDILGLALIDEDHNSFTLKAGITEICVQQHAGNIQPVYHIAFNIPCNKIQEASTWIATKVKRIYINEYKGFIADFVNWNAKSVYFYDPAGNIIELIARFDLNNASAQIFSAQQILSVSEIGLVFSDAEFESLTDCLLKEFNLSYFSKQPPLAHFRTAGDDEGLFIIVPENRVWYPTEDKKAIVSPIKIYFSNNSVDGWIEYEDNKYEMKAIAV